MNPMQFNEMALDPMRESDLDQVSAIEMVCFSSPWSRESFLFELHSENSCCMVGRLGKRVVGYIIGWFVLGELHIINIAVHPRSRRKGMGETMLRFLLGKAQQRGCRRATLELRVSNEAAQRLYEKHGFRPVAIRKAYYRRPVEDAVLMLREFGSGSREDPAGQEVQDGVVSKG